jgi:ribosomal protein L30E
MPFFDTIYVAGKRINKYARESEITIYVLKGAKIDVNKIIKKEIEKKKNY